MYEGEYERDSKPMKVKWFSEKNIKVLDVECGRDSALVKCKDKDGNIVFYGLCKTEDNIKQIGGGARTTKALSYLINKVEIDGNRVESFAMSWGASFILLRPLELENASIDPENPEETGLIHFYQDASTKDWKFTTPDKYEALKDELP